MFEFFTNGDRTMNRTIIFIGSLLVACLSLSMAYPFTPIETRTVNITEIWFQNSGIIVWGYWDNSTIEENVGLFQSGFKHDDVGHVYKVSFKEWPDPDIRCLKLVKKIELS